jgi:transcriptional regulator with XRE-family HTH domain
VEGDLQRQLGQSLRTRRRARGLSQEAFADLIGVHRTYMGGLERGERNVTLRTIERLADHLGIDAVELLLNEPSPLPADLTRQGA